MYISRINKLSKLIAVIINTKIATEYLWIYTENKELQLKNYLLLLSFFFSLLQVRELMASEQCGMVSVKSQSK